MKKTAKKLRLLVLVAVGFIITKAFSQTPVITLDLAKASTHVSPIL
jgi:hypothetical protein